jgi:hypothetical protein
LQAITPEEERNMPVRLPDDPVESERKTQEKEKREESQKRHVGASEWKESGKEERETAHESLEEKQPAEYEFTPWEDRILEVVMEAMRMAGLALAVRALATICLGVFPRSTPLSTA